MDLDFYPRSKKYFVMFTSFFVIFRFMWKGLLKNKKPKIENIKYFKKINWILNKVPFAGLALDHVTLSFSFSVWIFLTLCNHREEFWVLFQIFQSPHSWSEIYDIIICGISYKTRPQLQNKTPTPRQDPTYKTRSQLQDMTPTTRQDPNIR